MASDPAWMARLRAMGYSMIALGTDQGLLGSAVQRLVQATQLPG